MSTSDDESESCIPQPASRISPPATRIILLGASNLTMGLAHVLDAARAQCRGPLEILMAAGHGRSYGIHSTVLGRTLPGITQCGLWSALESRPPLPTAALVTDVGNDLMYEVAVERIVAWVEECLDALARLEARIVVTRLPLMNVRELSPRRFYALRSVLFPRCRLSLEDVSQRAHALDERLGALAGQRGLSLVEPRRAWYGIDPIHVLRRRRREAWREILAGWTNRPADLTLRPVSWRQRVALPLLRPEQRWLWGHEQRCVQPAARWANGETVAIY